MGINNLMPLIRKRAPQAITQIKHADLKNQAVAIDASMQMYQFLIATQTIAKKKGEIYELKDNNGILTGHLMGMLYKSVKLISHGIKPIWVFDGKPPMLKSTVIEDRIDRVADAKEARSESEAKGDLEQAMKMAQQSIIISPEMTMDAKKMLLHLGVPIVESPSEAEAQCAILVQKNLAYGTVSEDMDSLAFGSNILLRGMNSKNVITQIDLAAVLAGLEMNQKQFTDMCILQGCDYTDSIKGIGPANSLKLITEFGSIEKSLDQISSMKRYTVPEPFPYQEARKLFQKPDVISLKRDLSQQVKMTTIDEDNLLSFLVEKKGFQEKKIKMQIQKILDVYQQDGFFEIKKPRAASPKKTTSKSVSKESEETPKKIATTKAKANPQKTETTKSKAEPKKTEVAQKPKAAPTKSASTKTEAAPKKKVETKSEKATSSPEKKTRKRVAKD